MKRRASLIVAIVLIILLLSMSAYFLAIELYGLFFPRLLPVGG